MGIKDEVRRNYAQAISSVGKGCCCTGSCCGPSRLPDGYNATEMPELKVKASFGCGNPTALASLQVGESVLDLGCGAGLDLVLSASRVGPTGRVFGLDMTDEMLAVAQENIVASGYTNIELLKGDIESIPLPDNSVDVIISNCVINLAADKGRVLREAYRVLKPGGRLAVFDIILKHPLPESLRRDAALWSACISGAMLEEEYLNRLRETGFIEASIELYDYSCGEDQVKVLGSRAQDVKSGFVRAVKPA